MCSQSLEERGVQRPGNNSRNNQSEKDVEHNVPGIVGRICCLPGPEIKDRVCTHGRRSAVVQVKEPHSAVDECESKREQSINGADVEAVHRYLEGLARRFINLPADVRNCAEGHCYGQDEAGSAGPCHDVHAIGPPVRSADAIVAGQP